MLGRLADNVEKRTVTFTKDDKKIWLRLYMRYKRKGYEPIAKWQREYEKLIAMKKQIIEDERRNENEND